MKHAELGRGELAAEVNSIFTAGWGEDLELIQFQDAPASPGYECFLLIFRGSADLVAPQGTYAFSHVRLGTFPLFVGPVRRDSTGTYYQAVFNRVGGGEPNEHSVSV